MVFLLGDKPQHGESKSIYDGVGQRVERVLPNGATTTYVYDAFGRLAAEYSNSVLPERPGGPSTSYLSWDQLGSIRLVTDSSGNVVSRHDYEPFGGELASGTSGRTLQWGATDGVPQRFTAAERDPDTGTVAPLDFFQARYLATIQMRFLSPDPANAGASIYSTQSWNGYAYVMNSPVDSIDPDGLQDCQPPCASTGPVTAQSGGSGTFGGSGFSFTIPWGSSYGGDGAQPVKGNVSVNVAQWPATDNKWNYTAGTVNGLFLNLPNTLLNRQGFPIDKVVNRQGRAYKAGAVTGMIVGMLLGVGEVEEAAAVVEAAEGGGTVQIFRAVGQSETSSILNAGTYGSAPSMGGKYFALTQQGAQDFANASFNAGRQMSLTRTTIPQSVFNQGFLFNDVGGAGASIHFQQDFLPTLYNSMGPIKIH